MTDKIITRARELAAQWFDDTRSHMLHRRAVLRGDCDTGEWVKQFIPVAEAEALRNREEAEGE